MSRLCTCRTSMCSPSAAQQSLSNDMFSHTPRNDWPPPAERYDWGDRAGPLTLDAGGPTGHVDKRLDVRTNPSS
eukprot:5816582-Pyramimonas_sp.AAC.1